MYGRQRKENKKSNFVTIALGGQLIWLSLCVLRTAPATAKGVHSTPRGRAPMSSPPKPNITRKKKKTFSLLTKK